MSKKTTKPKSAVSDSCHQMNRYFLVGDFFSARKCAKKILASPADAEDSQSAQGILKKTWPDSQALLAGVGCLLFSVAVAFIAGH